MSLNNTVKQWGKKEHTERTFLHCAVFTAPMSNLKHFVFADESADAMKIRSKFYHRKGATET